MILKILKLVVGMMMIMNMNIMKRKDRMIGKKNKRLIMLNRQSKGNNKRESILMKIHHKRGSIKMKSHHKEENIQMKG